jgi:N-acetylmuramoyl-L-alanine amidase
MNIIDTSSPNHTLGRKIYRAEAIVVHIMEGTLKGTDSWFKNPNSKVSSHYGIGKNGETHRYVRETDTAWHAGRVNAPVWKLIKKAGNGIYINPNYYTIGIEHEGNERSEWTDEMYEASAALIKDIAQRWNIPLDRSHVIGHHEIYSLKTCPGFKVDLNKLIAMAGGVVGEVSPVHAEPVKTKQTGKVTTKVKLNIRSRPDTKLPPVNIVESNIQLAFDGFTNEGENVKGNSKWYYTDEGPWFWSGGVTTVNENQIIPSVPNVTTPGKSCFDLIKKWEGLRLDAYQDVAGIWTIGYGTIKYEDNTPVKKGQTITAERAEQLLIQEALAKSAGVNTAISDTQLNQ